MFFFIHFNDRGLADDWLNDTSLEFIWVKGEQSKDIF